MIITSNVIIHDTSLQTLNIASFTTVTITHTLGNESKKVHDKQGTSN